MEFTSISELSELTVTPRLPPKPAQGGGGGGDESGGASEMQEWIEARRAEAARLRPETAGLRGEEQMAGTTHRDGRENPPQAVTKPSGAAPGRAAGTMTQGGVCPAARTVIRHDGPNHLGLWCNALPEHQMALITSDCAPLQSTARIYSPRTDSEAVKAQAALARRLGSDLVRRALAYSHGLQLQSILRYVLQL